MSSGRASARVAAEDRYRGAAQAPQASPARAPFNAAAIPDKLLLETMEYVETLSDAEVMAKLKELEAEEKAAGGVAEAKAGGAAEAKTDGAVEAKTDGGAADRELKNVARQREARRNARYRRPEQAAPADGASPRNPSVQAAPADGAAPRNPNELHVGGVSLNRAARPMSRLNPAQQQAFNELSNPRASIVPGMVDWRSAQTARQAASQPPVTDSDGKPVSLGKLTIYRPGAGNVAPSAAQIFRLAQHSEKFVMAYQNTSDPSKNHLRAVDEIEGVPVPKHLKGKIFVIGDPDNRSWITFDQASDNFISQLGAMHEAKDLLGFDPLHAKATVFGVSQGGMDAALTRDRLEREGFKDTFGRVVALGSPFHGDTMPVSRQISSAIVQKLEEHGDAPDARRLDRTIQEDGHTLVQRVGGNESVVDLSVASVLGGPAPYPSVVDNIRPYFRATSYQASVDEAREDFRYSNPLLAMNPLLANNPMFTMNPFTNPGLSADTANKAWGGDYDSDGMVPVRSTQFGQRHMVLDEPHDHVGICEDPAVIDRILENL